MAELVFFASIREELDCDRLQFDVPEGTTVFGLIDLLAESRGDRWRRALTAENIRVAVNQELTTENPVLSRNDEVAFFPPVTGG